MADPLELKSSAGGFSITGKAEVRIFRRCFEQLRGVLFASRDFVFVGHDGNRRESASKSLGYYKISLAACISQKSEN
jgi:hypothetical protein